MIYLCDVLQHVKVLAALCLVADEAQFVDKFAGKE